MQSLTVLLSSEASSTSVIKTFLGVARASTKTVMGVARASVKKWVGVTN